MPRIIALACLVSALMSAVVFAAQKRGALPTDDPTLRLPRDVHFTKDGSAELAKSVVASIEQVLAAPAK